MLLYETGAISVSLVGFLGDLKVICVENPGKVFDGRLEAETETHLLRVPRPVISLMET